MVPVSQLPVRTAQCVRRADNPADVILPSAARRRQTMAEGAGGDEMESVKNYFDTEGFNRWKRIYGETDVGPRTHTHGACASCGIELATWSRSHRSTQ